MLTMRKESKERRLAKYGAAAVAVAASGLAAPADADIVSQTGLNLTSVSSNELFIDIQGFAIGASTFSIATATSAASFGTPLGGTATDLMIRGAFAAGTGTAELRGNNGALIAADLRYVTGPGGDGSAVYVVGVDAVGNRPTFAGTTFGIGYGAGGNGTATNFNAFLDWPWQNGPGGDFPIGGGANVAYFTFVNANTGGVHEGWLDIEVTDQGGNVATTVTGIHIETVPEPSSMSLLCLGAAGLATYRRRRKSA